MADYLMRVFGRATETKTTTGTTTIDSHTKSLIDIQAEIDKLERQITQWQEKANKDKAQAMRAKANGERQQAVMHLKRFNDNTSHVRSAEVNLTRLLKVQSDLIDADMLKNTINTIQRNKPILESTVNEDEIEELRDALADANDVSTNVREMTDIMGSDMFSLNNNSDLDKQFDALGMDTPSPVREVDSSLLSFDFPVLPPLKTISSPKPTATTTQIKENVFANGYSFK